MKQASRCLLLLDKHFQHKEWQTVGDQSHFQAFKSALPLFPKFCIYHSYVTKQTQIMACSFRVTQCRVKQNPDSESIVYSIHCMLWVLHQLIRVFVLQRLLRMTLLHLGLANNIEVVLTYHPFYSNENPFESQSLMSFYEWMSRNQFKKHAANTLYFQTHSDECDFWQL